MINRAAKLGGWFDPQWQQNMYRKKRGIKQSKLSILRKEINWSYELVKGQSHSVALKWLIKITMSFDTYLELLS